MTHLLRALRLSALVPIALVAQDTTATKAALIAADREAAANKMAWSATLAPRATVLLPGQEILHGRAAFAPHLTRLAWGRTPAWTPVHAAVAANGGFGCTTGVLHLVATDSTQPSTGRYLACWRRTRNAQWRIIAWSAALAPPAVKTLPDSLGNPPGSTGVRAGRGARPARAMADADRAFGRFSADSGGPAGAFSRWIAADGMMLGARAVPAQGPADARAAFAAFPPTGRFEWAPVDSLTVAARDGSLGFTIGEARIAPTPESVSYSKYLTVWRRERDGSYRWIFDTGSDRPVPHVPR